MIKWDNIFGQPAAIKFLRAACVANRLPHALVFAGPVGVGKATCAMALAGPFLCHKPRGDIACGACESCRVLTAGNHPDFHLVTKELIRYHDKTGKSKATVLAIDVIRNELVAPAARTATLGHGKFFLVEQADLMNSAAQNALLKTLEEPAGRTAIVLLTDAPESLFPTVLSRCQMVRFARLETALVRQALLKRGISAQTADDAAELSDGSLGRALRMIDEGIIPAARELQSQIDGLFSGNAPADLPGWLRKAADAHADKELERDPLASKDAASRAGLNLYLMLADGAFQRRLHQQTDANELEKTCSAIDAIARCRMYLDANVNVAVALAQLAAAWNQQFAEA